ncbi:MAG TPA: hypothetical protein PK264_13975 [Hyphomicrobiaceae bacterium]|nr:hypothetical protein [Hyphomicrobiaceae bacterium]
MIARAAAAIAFLSITLLSAVSWGVPSAWHLVPVMIPFAYIHAAAHEPRAALGAAATFAGGVLTDTLTDGPLGFWALLYLVGYLASTQSATLVSDWRGNRPMSPLVAMLTAVPVASVVVAAIAAAATLRDPGTMSSGGALRSIIAMALASGLIGVGMNAALSRRRNDQAPGHPERA